MKASPQLPCLRSGVCRGALALFFGGEECENATGNANGLDGDKGERQESWRLFLAGLGDVLQRYFGKIPAVGAGYLQHSEQRFERALCDARSPLPG